jgi:hypothetical protein
MTSHAQSIGQTTQMARNGSLFGSSMEARHNKQVQMLLVLVRSLRRVELCRRDFVVLLGTQVPLSEEHQASLQREGLLLRPAPPLIPGVPTADKLHVWTLTNYTQCVVLDADLMFLKPIDDLFDSSADLTIAHHPYDLLQAQCGVPVAKRGIAAMILMRPDLSTYHALMSYLLRRFKAEQLLYSDQTGLMCFFGNRSRTLPCPYLYDVSMMADSFLPRWVRNCRTFSRQHVLKNCLPDIADGCRSLSDRRICEVSRVHMHGQCHWPSAAASAHAVHFKGNTKPWPSAMRVQCRHMKHGMPGVRVGGEGYLTTDGAGADGTNATAKKQIALMPTDALGWNASWSLRGAARPGACVSARWGLLVYWARNVDGPILHQRCCTPSTLMAAKWNELLRDHGARALY